MSEEGVLAKGKRLLTEESTPAVGEAQKPNRELSETVREIQKVLPRLDKLEAERKEQIQEMISFVKAARSESAPLDPLEKTALQGMIAYFRSLGIVVEQ